MSSRPSLRLDWCSQKAARYAVEKWHYSARMPKSKLSKLGVWEGEKFVGSIIYGVGANRHLSSPFGLQSIQACELVRVALAPRRSYPTSKCLAISLRLLKKASPGLKIIVSYADQGQGHDGIIYQATGWIYLGATEQSYLKILGEIVHPRTVYDRYGPGGQSLPWLLKNVDRKAERVPMAPKLKYIYCLDPKLRDHWQAKSLPYPKTRARSIDSDAPTLQVGDGGASPTLALQSSPLS